jgi:hypothetical protein
MLFAPLELDPYERWWRKSEKLFKARQAGDFQKVELSPEALKALQEAFPYLVFMVI